jgi:hypothetical protein
MVVAVDSLQITAKAAKPTRREGAAREAVSKETPGIPPIGLRLRETLELAT